MAADDAQDPKRLNSDETRIYFSKLVPVENLSGSLPHWRQEGTTYFVTFRLADALPTEVLRQWEMERADWSRRHPQPYSAEAVREYNERFPKRLQRWLDAGQGSCLLGREEAAEVVARALRHFDGNRYQLDEHIVASNHVHALVTPSEDHGLTRILHSWKSYTAHRLLELLEGEHRDLKRSFPDHQIWQRETFDHIVRSRASLEKFRSYIRAHREYRPRSA